MKTNNATSDREMDKVARATDSDIATFGSASHDPGDTACITILFVVEDEENSDKIPSCTFTPEVAAKGHSELVRDPTMLQEALKSVPLGSSTMSEMGTCPSMDHSEGDAHPKMKKEWYNSYWVCIQSRSAESTEE